MGHPGGIGRVEVGRLVVNWLSRPLIQAHVRLRQIREQPTDAGSEESVGRMFDSKSIILTVTGPGRLSAQASEQRADLKKKKTKEPIAVETMRLQQDPEFWVLYFYFPGVRQGQPTLTLADEEVRFYFEIGESKFNVRFKLKEMLVKGT